MSETFDSLQATLDGNLRKFTVTHLHRGQSPDRDVSKCRKLVEWNE